MRPANVTPIPRGSASGDSRHRGRSERRRATTPYPDNNTYHRQGPYGPDGGGFYQQDSDSLPRTGQYDHSENRGYSYSQSDRQSRRTSRSNRSDFFSTRESSTSSAGSWHYVPPNDFVYRDSRANEDGSEDVPVHPHILDIPGNVSRDFIRCLKCTSVYHKSWVDKDPRGTRYVRFECEYCIQNLNKRGGSRWAWMPWNRDHWLDHWFYTPRYHLHRKIQARDRGTRSRAPSRGPRGT